MTENKQVRNSRRVSAAALKKAGPKVTVSRSPPLMSNPAHRGRRKRMEADNQRKASLGLGAIAAYHIRTASWIFQRTSDAPGNNFAVANTLRHEKQPFHSDNECTILTSSFDCKK